MSNKEPKELSHIYSCMMNRYVLCDTVIKTDDSTEFRIHKSVLGLSGDFFWVLFLSLMRNPITVSKTFQETHLIPVISTAAFQCIIEYAYDGYADRKLLFTGDLLQAADRFLMNDLIQTCSKILADHLDITNVVSIYQTSKFHNCPWLLETSRRFLLKHITQVVKSRSSEFVRLKADELALITDNDNLCVSNEKEVFDMIVKWVKHDCAGRRQHFDELVKTVRFGLLKDTIAKNCIRNHSFVNGSLDSELNGNVVSRSRVPSSILFAIGGWHNGTQTNDFETYNSRTQRWISKLYGEQGNRAHHGMVAVDGLIYIIGGLDSAKYLNTVQCFDPQQNIWMEKSCMHHRRCYVSVCDLDGTIYALGGYNGRTRMNSVEAYDPHTNQWTKLNCMKQPRSDASAAAFKGKVYIAGGYNGEEILKTVEMYNTQRNVWTYTNAMSIPRSGLSVIAFSNRLYALGGSDGSHRLATCECYNLQKNKWTSITKMNSPRTNFGCCILENEIYVIGGFDGVTMSMVESFNPSTKVWTNRKHMTFDRSALTACVLEDLTNAQHFLQNDD